MAAAAGLTVCVLLRHLAEDIKTKFRNLRTMFQREHKAVSSNRTCGSEDFYLPKWRHYRQLRFLCDSCDEEESQELRLRLPASQTLPSAPRCRGDVQANARPSPPSPTPPDTRCSSPSAPITPSLSSSHPGSRGRKRAGRAFAPPPGAQLLDLVRTLCEGQPPTPHSGFLRYVEECLNETPPEKVRRLKMKIIEMIHSVAEEV